MVGKKVRMGRRDGKTSWVKVFLFCFVLGVCFFAFYKGEQLLPLQSQISSFLLCPVTYMPLPIIEWHAYRDQKFLKSRHHGPELTTLL